MTGPPARVLRAFGATGTLEGLAGGQGRTFRCGDLVLKPVADEAEHAWVCEVYDAWTSADVRVPKPVRSGNGLDGGWSLEGWAAHRWVEGRTAHAADDPDRFRATAEAFHAAVAGLPRPGFLDTRDDAWSFGDRVAWGGEQPVGSPEVLSLLAEARRLLRPVEVAAQVVHGDLGGNVLWHEQLPPAVIDWPPYFRPAGWALAVIAMDAVCWQGADPALLSRWSDLPEWDQMLLRAVIYRVATRGRNECLGVVPSGSDGYLAARGESLRLVRARIEAGTER